MPDGEMSHVRRAVGHHLSLLLHLISFVYFLLLYTLFSHFNSNFQLEIFAQKLGFFRVGKFSKKDEGIIVPQLTQLATIPLMAN